MVKSKVFFDSECLIYAKIAIILGLSALSMQNCQANSINYLANNSKNAEKTIQEDVQNSELCLSPYLINTQNSPEIFAELKKIKKIPKTEWMTFDEYFSKNKVLFESVIKNSKYKCNRFYLRIPLKWNYDPEKSEIDFDLYWMRNLDVFDLKPSDTGVILSSGYRHSHLDIEGTAKYHGIKVSLSWENIFARRIKQSPIEIKRCIVSAYKISSQLTSISLEDLIYNCRKTHYSDVITFTENEKDKSRIFVNRFPISMQDAKNLRDHGLFLFVKFRIGFDFFRSSYHENTIHAITEDVFIGGSDSNSLFCSHLKKDSGYNLFEIKELGNPCTVSVSGGG